MPLLPPTFRPGQALWRVTLTAVPQETPAKVTKIGRRWISVKLGRTGFDHRRFDPSTMLEEGGEARYWLSEAEYRQHQEQAHGEG